MSICTLAKVDQQYWVPCISIRPEVRCCSPHPYTPSPYVGFVSGRKISEFRFSSLSNFPQFHRRRIWTEWPLRWIRAAISGRARTKTLI